MAQSKLKRTIYTHSGVQVGPMAGGNFGATAATALWGDNMWDWNPGVLAAGPIHGLKRPANNAFVNPRTVQNATMTLNIPRADVNVFGVLGVVDRPQLEAETATLEFAFIPEKKDSHQLSQPQSSIYPTDLHALIGDSLSQEPEYVYAWADGVGSISAAMMNSFSGEATIGALPTMTMGFTGRTDDYANLDYSAGADGNAECLGLHVPCPTPASAFQVDLVEPGDIDLHQIGSGVGIGDPGLDAAQLPDALAQAGNVNPNLINEPAEVSVGGASGLGAGTPRADVESWVNPDTDIHVQTGCAQSASFAWDLPVETLLCLGANPKHDGVTLGNPPGTSSFTVEALSLQLERNVNAQNYNLRIGVYNFQLVNGAIDSRTHNLAVGDLFGSYNYVIGGTADGFNPVNIPGSDNTTGMGLSLDGTV